MKITSTDNEKIKLLRKLNNKKYRQKFDKFFIENFKIIFDAARAGFLPDSIFYTEDFEERNKKDLDFIVKKSKIKDVYLINNKVNKTFSNLDTCSGIAAIYEKIDKKIDLSGKVIYLNSINDPGNLGAILRSGLAFDVKNFVLDAECADLYNSKTINAARDSIFKLNVEIDKNLRLFKKIKKKMEIYSTSLSGKQEVGKIKKEKKFCIVFGNEAHGVDPVIQKMSEGFIKIKMSEQIESLNVSAAAAIIFYEIFK